MNCYAKVIADSVSPKGDRLTTMEVQTWRFVLAEFNTHRRFSRNSASSRAIPFKKQLQRMEDLGPAFPIEWPAEQRGMQGGESLTDERIQMLRGAWEMAARQTADMAKAIHNAGLHKSVVNRLLEPFMWHKIIVSSTEWDNFFTQRCSPLAQPEIRVTAEAMQKALKDSTPYQVQHDGWHLPYIDDETYDHLSDRPTPSWEEAIRVSAARCARVSYLTHDGKRDIEVDLDLYNKLVTASPPHWSPLEHVAVPSFADGTEDQWGNFDGWTQLRHIIANNLQERY